MGLLSGLLKKSRSSHHVATIEDRAADAQRPEKGGDDGTPQGDSIIATIADLNAAGHYAKSLKLLTTALDANSGRQNLLFARAMTLSAWGRLPEALQEYERLAADGSPDASLCLRFGLALLGAGHVVRSEPWLRKAATADAQTARQAIHGLIAVLVAMGRRDEAAGLCRQSLELDPADAKSLLWLGHCGLQNGDSQAAEAAFARASQLDPDDPVVWMNLGNALHGQERYAEALSVFEQAHRIEQKVNGNVNAYVNVAKELFVIGRLDDAIAICEANLPRQPAVEGHRIYAEALLAAGRLAQAWDHYEFRWLSEPLLSARHSAEVPPWAGQDVRGKTLAIRVEQGIGDMIQILRYASDIRALGARTALWKFSELARHFEGIDDVYENARPRCDFYVQAMSLPRIFGTELTTIPAGVPYLRIDENRVQRWSERLGARRAPRVGIVWAGNPVHQRDAVRSIPLRLFEPLLALGGVEFFSLQKGAAAAQLAIGSGGRSITDLGRELNDFSDTAAVISLLDLVVCVDTAVAHLAGAIGGSTWILLQNDADWRWLREREDTPWYPTMRLFRQTQPGDWAEVLERVAAALAQQLEGAATSLKHSSAKERALERALRPAVREWRLPHGAERGFSAVTETRVGIVQYFAADGAVGKAIGWYGEYLHLQVEFLARLVRPGATVIEVQPGVGVHALALAATIGPEGRLMLFESRPIVRRVLRQNLVANRTGNAIILERSLGMSGVNPVTADPSLPVDTLDDYLLQELALIKINEGVDAAEVLTSATASLWRLRPLVFVSATGESNLRAIAAILQAHGYRCWRSVTPMFNPRNFNLREADIFDGATALAVFGLPEEVGADVDLAGCTEL